MSALRGPPFTPTFSLAATAGCSCCASRTPTPNATWPTAPPGSSTACAGWAWTGTRATSRAAPTGRTCRPSAWTATTPRSTPWSPTATPTCATAPPRSWSGAAGGPRPAVRFRLPDEGETVVEDLVRGTVVFDNATLTDFVILRANGIPTYHFSATLDDVDMAVSHVIRGEDLFPSTPRHIHVFRALGRETPPAFAHLPLIVGADRRKLSKRRDRVSVQQFRDEGYLPEAMVNYLALLGWSLDDHTELFTLADLERLFSLERVSRNPAAFDIKKLDALNGHYLRRLDPADFAARALPFVEAAGDKADPELLAAAAPLVQERVNHLTEVPGMVGFLLTDEVELDPAAAAKVVTDEGRAFLAEAAARLDKTDPWTAAAIEATLRGLQQERDLKPKTAFQPVRLAVTGRLVSPPLFESMELLGKARSLARLERAAAQAG